MDASTSNGSATVLVAHDVKVAFGGNCAVDGVSMEVGQGEVLGLIGPNGAGKTTLLNALSGLVPLTEGTVRLDGSAIGDWTPERRARLGLARTFQDVRLYSDMTVRENIELGALGAGERAGEARARAETLMEAFSLTALAEELAGRLPLGTQRQVGVARAAAGACLILAMDEPAAGLNDHEVEDLLRSIRRVGELKGCGIVLVEHNMRLVMEACDRIHVLDRGRTLAIGAPAAIRQDPQVIDAYLGA
ncbi:MAG TPA: ATP-binding cassette domain-containing protein [Conexibacter sp.]|nr:ATP-binding cassette domain-containing protein [Conexibacter sp.]